MKKWGRLHCLDVVVPYLKVGVSSLPHFLGSKFDESRLGLKTEVGRLITVKGVKPLGTMQWKRENFYLYGLVEPLTGEYFIWEFSHLNTSFFQIFLEKFAVTYPEEIHIIQLDNGAFHLSQYLKVPANIILLFQPAHTPQVNPIERLWQEIKRN